MIVKDLREIDAVRRYLKRMNAEPMTLYKARIDDFNDVEFNKDDGTVTICSALDQEGQAEAERDFLPNRAEQEAIRREWPRGNFQGPRMVRNVRLPELRLIEVIDPDEGSVILLRQTVGKKGDEKVYLSMGSSGWQPCVPERRWPDLAMLFEWDFGSPEC